MNGALVLNPGYPTLGTNAPESTKRYKMVYKVQKCKTRYKNVNQVTIWYKKYENVKQGT